MNAANKAQIISIINTSIASAVNNYSECALLINACFVAGERYGGLEPDRLLSTTANIPDELRLPFDLDVQYTFKELAVKYPREILAIVLRNYVVVSVSIVDEMLEELYEYLIKIYDPTITENALDKEVRQAWTNDNLVNFLIDPNIVNLQKPADLHTTFSEAMMFYNELRIVRNTLLHTGGRLSNKNYNKLQENLTNTPAERKHMAMANAPIFNANREIELSINHILSIRLYLHNFLNYLSKSITEKVL